MKYGGLMLLLLIVVVCAKEVRRPAFIVDGEPFPQGLTLTYEQPLSSSDSVYKTLFFDATPLVINKSDKFQLFGMVGAMADIYDDSLRNSSGPVPDNYLGVYGAVNLSGAFGKNFFFQSYHSVGAFAAEANIGTKDALKYFQVTTIGKKWKPNFQTSLGLLSTTRHGDPLFIPLAKVTYAHTRFVIDAILPVSVKFRFMPSDDFHLVTYYSSATTGYATKKSMEAVQRSCSEIGINAERRIKGWFWFKAGALLATKTSFTAIDDEYDKTLWESPTHMKALVELFVRPD